MTALRPSNLPTTEPYVEHALQVLKRAGLRITQPRTQVLTCLAKATAPMNAYELQQRLQSEGVKADVVSIYRILDCLETHHLVHKVPPVGKFVRCLVGKESSHGNEAHDYPSSTAPHASSGWVHVLLLCQACHNLNEIQHSGFQQQLQQLEAEQRFHFHNQTLTLLGYCERCCPQHDSSHAHS